MLQYQNMIKIWEERFCCITVIRCCRCTVHSRV